MNHRRDVPVEFVQSFVGDVASLVVFVLLIAGTMKVFQMSTDMREIKDILKDIKRNTQQVAMAAPAAAPAMGNQVTAEELVRAVNAQNFSGDEFPVLEPVVIPPQK
jgi:hypothetical protein